MMADENKTENTEAETKVETTEAKAETKPIQIVMVSA